MKAISPAFVEFRKRLFTAPDSTGRGKIETKVEMTEVQTNTTLELNENDYLIRVGEIQDRVERTKLNDFAPSECAITVHDPQDHPVFFTDAEDGYFDDKSIKYQIKVYKGIKIGVSIEWIMLFDGELQNRIIERIGEHRVQFTCVGWLKEAERYNAEEIADPNSPPFRNITGISVDYGVLDAITGPLGARHMEFGEDQGTKWLRFDGGEKVNVTGDGTYLLYDSVREATINILVDISETSDDSQTDYFTIIMVAGVKEAHYWYENVTLEFIVGLLIDKLEEGTPGAITRDIDVREIESGIAKNFVYLPPIIPSSAVDLKVTCFKVVDVTGTVITAVVGTEWEKGVFSRLYKIVIDTDDPTNYATTVVATEVSRRFIKFVYFSGSTWVVIGKEAPNTWLGLTRWRAEQIRKFSADWSTFSETKLVPVGSYNFHLAYSFSEKYGTDEVYCLFTEYITGTPGHWKFGLRKYKYSTDTWSDVQYPLKTDSFPDDHGIYAIQNSGAGAKHYFYYGYESEALPGTHHGVRWNITDSVSETIWTNSAGDPVDEIINFTWERKDGSYLSKVFSKFKEATGVSTFDYHNIWIDPDGTYSMVNEGSINKTRFMGENPIETGFFTSWYYDSSKWYIKAHDSETEQGYKEDNWLHVDYKGDEIAAQIYEKNNGTDFSYVGVVTDNYTIVPFIYIAQMLPTVRLADFSGSVRKALSEFATAFLDVLIRPEIQKVVFRYRESFRDTDTLDSNDCDVEYRVAVWKHYYDGVIIKNSRDNLLIRRGETGFDAKVLVIDNRFLAQGIIEQVADWYYTFYNAVRRLIKIQRDMYIEPELMDKITVTLRKPDGTIKYTLNTMVLEASFVPSPKGKDYYRMKMELLEIGGATYREHNLIGLEEYLWHS